MFCSAGVSVKAFAMFVINDVFFYDIANFRGNCGFHKKKRKEEALKDGISGAKRGRIQDEEGATGV